MKLVVDASVALAAAATPHGFARFRRHELIAPGLLRYETSSALHEAAWRGELAADQSGRTHERLLEAGIALVDSVELSREAWRVADEFGWAKTYDASYVALARINACQLVTLDARLRRGTERLGFVIAPGEL